MPDWPDYRHKKEKSCRQLTNDRRENDEHEKALDEASSRCFESFNKKQETVTCLTVTLSETESLRE